MLPRRELKAGGHPGQDALHPDPHELDGAPGHDVRLEAVVTQIGEQLQHRLVLRHPARARGRHHVGRLDKALDDAAAKGWIVADMKRDWKVIYPFQR